MSEKEIVRGNNKFRLQRNLIVQHENEQDEVLDYWRIVVPEHAGIRDKIIRECHHILYCAHPGVQQTLSRVRKSFVWKGMSADVRAFIEKRPTCQIEKSDHVLRREHLQSLGIPQAKWQGISIDFITDLPRSRNGEDSIMVVVNRATKMVHLVPCRKTITAAGAAELYWRNIVKLHGVPKAIHSDRGSAIYRSCVERTVVAYWNQFEVWDSVSPSKPRAGGEDEFCC